MRKTIITFIIALMAMTCTAQNFNDYFSGNTLRLDYVFAGDRDRKSVV